jgi:hypothetical protein
MKAKRQGSSARGKRTPESAWRESTRDKPIPDDEIDYSDIPPLTDEQLRAMRPVGRPPVGDATKIPISFRINPNLLERIRAIAADRGEPYQSFMHDLLERAAARHARTR